MNGEITYIQIEQALVIHADKIERYCGSHGIRDLSFLESALFRSQATFSGEDLYQTVFDKAAALLHFLVLNHLFVDGNKRTGITTTLIFLLLNGKTIDVSNKEIIQIVLDISAKKYPINEISSWLEKNTK